MPIFRFAEKKTAGDAFEAEASILYVYDQFFHGDPTRIQWTPEFEGVVLNCTHAISELIYDAAEKLKDLHPDLIR